MVSIPDSLRALVAAGPLAHVVTLEPDGRPQVTCVWIGIEGDEIYFASLFPRRKVDNIGRDSRVAVSFEAGTTNEWGLREYAVVNGRARVEEGGGKERLTRLATVYMEPGADFPPADAPDGVTVFITPERIGGIGPWAGA